MSINTAPTDLFDLYTKIKEAAKAFGFDDKTNGIFRDCVTKNSRDSIREVSENEHNFWFGYIREDQPTGGAYEGLSYVIFPEHDKKRCLVSIGIGSSSMGKDGDLASNPGFRRSFMRLTKNDVGAKFYFKLRFDEMETSTPGIQEEICSESEEYEDAIINTTSYYNASDDKEAPGLLPAAFIVDYKTVGGWNLIKAWLAQYAKWRSWDKYKTGSDKIKISKTIKDTINTCVSEVKCPTPDDVKEILDKHKYVVLQGAPGCGKTWTANEVSKMFSKIIDGKEKNLVVFTQFHAETTYSDFVYGIHPTLSGESVAYKGKKGVLLRAIDMAEEAKKEKANVLLIIDEINRANLANVLGPVFYLFEPQAERSHFLELGEIYDENSKKDSEIKIDKLPENLYVLATMNTADKSLAVVDFALRRRFAWVTLRPHKLDDDKFDQDFFEDVDKLFMKYATDEELNLQPGQSYFMDKDLRKANIKYGLMPLMKEYFAEGFMLPAKEEFAQLFTSESGEYMYE